MRMLWLVTALSVLGGCEANLVGNGDVVEDERLLQSFAAIRTWGAIRTTITLGIGQDDTVRVRTDRNLTTYIDSDVVDGVLEVGGERGRAIEPTYLELIVTAPTMSSFVSEGWGDMIATGVDADLVEVAMNGEGQVRLYGMANTLSLTSKKVGTFDGRRLVAGEVELELRGNGDTYAYALDAISGQTYGTGTVFVHGSPAVIDIRDYGGGDVRGDDE